ncbi:hypothetical protein ABZ070_07860 [Streptomyces sp. NPDC006283]|uniref:hypothetical protein n=1 Tax=Streptomyces sp. NPDC006283 TaxID=3156741 RepID=UPI0033AA22B5
MIESTVPDRTDTPAVALGRTALALGAVSAVGAWVPVLAFFTLPWGAIAGALAVTLGLAGIHYARNGIGRLWTAVAGTTLGAIGFTAATTLVWSLGA